MPFRYRLVGFGPAEVANPKALLTALGGTTPSALHNPSFEQWSEIASHLNGAGTESLLVQEGVRDPDFLEEHEAFYSKQHRDISRHCIRVHAFRRPLPAIGATADRHEVLAFIDSAALSADSYVGFVTLRPLRHAPVGATILRDLATAPSLCKDVYPVHIAGTTFTVAGTPYLQQDNAVGACAQASIWMALRTIRRRLGNSAYSPAELTLAATKYLTQNRVFPGRQGLTVEQMLSAITASNHDPLVIPMAELPAAADPDKVIGSALPYIDSGLPVIAALMHPMSGGHAVVAIGLDQAPPQNHLPPALLIHNDNKGPYRLLPKTVAQGSGEYALEQAFSLIVPLPHGVFMSAAEATPQAVKQLLFWLGTFLTIPLGGGALPLAPLIVRTYLCTRHAFRKWAKDSPALDPSARDVYRTAEMPKLVWVVEIHDSTQFLPAQPGNSTRLGEVVLDAAADALHGDSLIFVRVSRHMVTAPTSSDGLLAIEGGGVVALATSPRCEGLTKPWEEA